MGAPRVDLAGFLSIIGKRWHQIAIVALLAAGIALALSVSQKPRYDASADVLFQKVDFAQTLFGSNTQGSQDAPERVAATNLALASLDVVAERVRRQLRTRLSTEALRKRVSVEPKGQANIVTITANARTRGEAVRIANAFAQAVVDFRRDAAQAKIQRAIDVLKRQQATGTPESPPGTNLSQRIDQLAVLKALQTGDVEVVQPAVPPKARAAPKPVRNAIIGFALGLAFGLLLVLVLHRLDRRVRDEEEVSALLQVPVLSRVPMRRRPREHEQQLFEAMQFLRVNLQLRDPARSQRIVSVTSPLPGDGKSTTVHGLSRAFALSGARVVAVDLDLRKPMLQKYFDLPDSDGVTEALVDSRNLNDFVQETSEPGVGLVAAGRLPSPSLLLGGMQRLPEMLNELRASCDYVIVDTPPVSVAADASAVAAFADAVIIVVDIDRVRRDVLSVARDQLHHARANLMGAVLNRTEAPIIGYEYAQYYGPNGEERETKPASPARTKRS